MPDQALEVRQPQQIDIVQPGADISISRAPQRVLDEARLAAAALQDVISKKKKPVIMNGEQYLEFEDWQTLGRFYGVTARVRETRPLTMGSAQGFEATAEAVRADGMVISAADAMCMNDEDKWGMRAKYEWKDGGRVQIGEVQAPFYQLRSMAQTRACAKALRNVLAWVVVLAGYKPTPAEEMAGVEAGNGSNEPSCPSCGKKGAIIKSKEEYGGGYLCYKKKGGCGAKFKDLPKQVLQGQPLDQDYGDDPWQDDVPAVNRSNINKAQAKLFWDTVKATGKTKEMVMEYFGGIGIEKTEEMPAKDFPAAYAWAGRPA